MDRGRLLKTCRPPSPHLAPLHYVRVHKKTVGTRHPEAPHLEPVSAATMRVGNDVWLSAPLVATGFSKMRSRSHAWAYL